MLTFFPRDDPKQALRLRRLLMACGSHLMLYVVMLVAVWIGLLDQRVTLQIVTAGTLLNILVYGVIRSGLNLKFRDPSLTTLQVMIPLSMVSYGMYFADHSRPAFLMAYMVVILFGLFRLKTRELLGIGAFAVTSYAVVIVLSYYNKPAATNLQQELLNAVVLSAVLPWFALIGGYLNNLRTAMREKNLQLESALAKIQDMAMRDDLTGVYNRRYLMERLAQEAARSERHANPFCLCMIDIDYFKRINDAHGHAAGDRVLRIFAGVVATDLRPTDCLARYGGEEFVLLLGDTTADQALPVAERTRKRIEETSFALRDIPRVTASIGIAQYLPPENIGTTLARADAALYQAKSAGRNRIVGGDAFVNGRNIADPHTAGTPKDSPAKPQAAAGSGNRP